MSEIKIGKNYVAKCDCYMNDGNGIATYVLNKDIVYTETLVNGLLKISVTDEFVAFIFKEQFELCFEIVEDNCNEKWNPSVGEMYYGVDFEEEENVYYTRNLQCDYDISRIEHGLAFKTKEEAVNCASKMLKALTDGGNE